MSRRALIQTKFCRAPTTLLLSTMNTWVFKSTSFPKGFISSFLRTLFLFINWISRQLGRSHTESKDTCHKTLLFLLTKRSCQTQEFCRAVPRYGLTLLDDGHPWNVVSPLVDTLQEGKRQEDPSYPSLWLTKNLRTYWSGKADRPWKESDINIKKVVLRPSRAIEPENNI